ncbi:MAG: circadian clock KaiB family protein [Synergistales bacterium]|nr:circadian clock KaiB family protein [Synergistales bacterium]
MDEKGKRQIHLKLFVTGMTARSSKAVDNLDHICSVYLKDRCTVEIVDVLEQPWLAEQDRILATPTLIRVRPEPERRVIGDLGEIPRVLEILDVGRGRSSSEKRGENDD